MKISTVASAGAMLFLLAGCADKAEEQAADFHFYEEPVYVPLDTVEGYVINPTHQDSVAPIILFTGDTVISGKKQVAIGHIVDQDSIQPPVKVKAGQPIITAANENIKAIPADLPVVPLNEKALIHTTFGQGTTTDILTNEVGDTVVPGAAVHTAGDPFFMRIKQVEASDPLRKDAANYDISFLDVNQGLSSSYLFTLFQDSRGDIWFGTYGQGAARYDGKTITYYSENEGFPDEEVVSIAEDKNGEIWLGTYGGGVVRYDGNSFTHYDEKEGLTGNIAFDMDVDQHGRIWIATNYFGLICFEPETGSKKGTFKTYTTTSGLSSNMVMTTFFDAQGNLWIGTDGGGVGMLEFATNGTEKEFTWYTTASGLQNDHVWSIAQTPRGEMWFGSLNGLCHFDGKNFTHYSQQEGLSNNRIRSLKIASDSTLWIGTSDGLNHFDGKNFTHYKTSNGITQNRLSHIIEDDAHNIWMGTWGGGACRFNPNGFANYYEAHGFPTSVLFSIMEEPDGRFWFSGLSGISHYDGSHFETYTMAQGMVDDYIRCLYREPNGDLWIAGFDHGLSYFDGTHFTNYTPANGLSGQRVSTFYKDRRGRMWIGTWDAGITVMDKDTIIHYTIKNGLSDDNVLVIMEDRNGIIWIGTDGGGITRFDGTSFTHFTEREGLAQDAVFSIVEDSRGRLWIGTNGAGVSIFDGTGFTNYGIRQGLVNGKVRSILEDKTGTIWVGTDGGMTCFIPDLTKQDAAGNPPYKLVSFISKDGLRGIDFNTNSAFIDSKNTAYWGTGKGLVTYDLNHAVVAETAPPTSLRAISLNGQQLNFRDTSDEAIRKMEISKIIPFENYPAELELPYTQNHVTFYFSALDWSAPEKLNYSYRLAGLNDDWSVPSTDAKADYHSLPYGDYTFEVKAVGESQNWGPVTSYAFSIQPPWWHTWWFRVVLILVAVCLIYAVVRWRTTALRKRQAELEKIVEERTIEVVNEKKAVEDQKTLIEEKNKEILDSISYAKRLQDAILPSAEFMQQYLPDSFMLYKPKDIVAGDFYWLESYAKASDSEGVTKVGSDTERPVLSGVEVSRSVETTVLFAVADCTGHGVPGAMVSVVCSNALNRAVKEFGITEPGKILDKVRELVIQTFEKSNSEVKDGMDISLFALNGNKLHWAGANNPLWIVRKTNTQQEIADSENVVRSEDGRSYLFEIKADKQPIGKYHHAKPFTNHIIDLHAGDKIYLFSDGYQDQFGGAKGKKFKASRLKEIILASTSKTMHQQCELLEETFEKWRGELEQLDDVCLAGIRV